MEQQTVLLTGFGPFYNHPVNASWEIVKKIKQLWSNEVVNLEIREIPVVYSEVSSRVPNLYGELHPSLCVHFGVSGYDTVTLENHGKNYGYKLLDVAGQTPPHNLCVVGGPDCIKTKFDLGRICSKYGETGTGVDIATSEDAGRYLCDFIYYTSLHQGGAPVLFVHVPPLNEPYSLKQLAAACKRIVEILIEEVQGIKVDEMM